MILRIYLDKFKLHKLKDKMLIRIYQIKFESQRYSRLLEIQSCEEHLIVQLEVHLANIFKFIKFAPGFEPKNH